MPWYGIDAINRMRNQALETERSERAPSSGKTPSRGDQIADAMPTVVAAAVWAVLCALIYCGVTGVREWNIVMTAACGPIAMAVIGAAWGTRKERLTAGLDLAIIVGAIIGVLFLVAALP